MLLSLSLVVPESQAKRMGGSRSIGRQAPMSRQAPRPPSAQRAPLPPSAAPAPSQRTQPDVARQSMPPAAPPPAPVRHASSPWGGMLGGALVGFGLGSLLSRHDNRDNRDAVNTNQSEGSSADETAQVANENSGNRFGSVLLWGLIAFAVFYLIRRSRRRGM